MLIDEPSLGLAPAIVEQAFSYIENTAKKVHQYCLSNRTPFGLSSANTGTVMDLVTWSSNAQLQVISDQRIRASTLERNKK